MICAKFTAVLACKSIAKTIFQKAAGPDNNRRLAVVIQHAAKLFNDLRGKLAFKETSFHFFKFIMGDMGAAGQLQAQTEKIIIYQEGKENV